MTHKKWEKMRLLSNSILTLGCGKASTALHWRRKASKIWNATSARPVEFHKTLRPAGGRGEMNSAFGARGKRGGT